jgi:hypothetical protein
MVVHALAVPCDVRKSGLMFDCRVQLEEPRPVHTARGQVRPQRADRYEESTVPADGLNTRRGKACARRDGDGLFGRLSSTGAGDSSGYGEEAEEGDRQGRDMGVLWRAHMRFLSVQHRMLNIPRSGYTVRADSSEWRAFDRGPGRETSRRRAPRGFDVGLAYRQHQVDLRLWITPSASRGGF